LASRRRTCARIAGSAAGGADGVENIEQAHVSLLTCPNPSESIARAHDGCKAMRHEPLSAGRKAVIVAM
jgi:hypothetical protein